LERAGELRAKEASEESKVRGAGVPACVSVSATSGDEDGSAEKTALNRSGEDLSKSCT